MYPAVRVHKYDGSAGAYYTLMMSTGLTFGTISSLFGLNHHIITQAQYSFLVGTVIASAVIPTMIANAFFLPRHLLPHAHPQAIKTAEQPVSGRPLRKRHRKPNGKPGFCRNSENSGCL